MSRSLLSRLLSPQQHLFLLVTPPLQEVDKGRTGLCHEKKPPDSEAPKVRLQVGLEGARRTSSEEGLRKKQSLPELGLGVRCSHCYLCLYPDTLSPAMAGLSQSQLIIDQVVNKQLGIY